MAVPPRARVGITTSIEQSLMAHLNRNLSGKVKRVEIVYTGTESKVAVQFYNGHVATTSLDQARSDEFLATCVIIYDLMPK